MSPERTEVEVDGRQLSLSNLEKVLYPSGFTKGAMLDYYARIAPAMMPHITDRPVTLHRFPDGTEGPSFFEKRVPSHAPPWVRTADVPSCANRSGQAAIEFTLVGDLSTLIWAANLATIEFHVPLWRMSRSRYLPARPDHIVFDLDPGPGTSIVECCRVASLIADRLGDDRRRPVAKTSGSKGLQLYLRLDGTSTWEETRAYAHELARGIEQDNRDLVVTNMRKDLRNERVLIDWSQNHPAKTTVAAYSLRAKEAPTVSTPVTWEEIHGCVKSGDPDQLRFLAHEVIERVQRVGDLFAPLIA